MVQRWLSVGIILLFLGAGVIPSTANQRERLSSPLFTGDWWYVGGSGPNNYTRIQDAIDNASDGDTVFVYKGTYVGFIVANKAITLLGEDKNTTIIVGYFAYTITLSADGVTVSGFTIYNNAGRGEGVRIDSSYNTVVNNIIDIPRDRIRLYGDSNVFSHNILNNTYLYLCGDGNTVSNNSFNNSYYGMYLIFCRDNIIAHNSFSGSGVFISDATVGDNVVTDNYVNGKPLVYLTNESDAILDGGAGQIVLFHCSNITVQNQELSNTTVGIQLWETSGCAISDCTFAGNRYGLYIRGGNNTIAHCFITANFFGVYLSGDDNTISGNSITHNQGNGIYLSYSNDNTVIDNILTNNNYSIMLDFGCMYDTIARNTITNNNHTALVLFSCRTALITDNIIENNDGDGIDLLQTDDTTITNSTIGNNTGCGINGAGSDHNTITHNMISHNNDDGIHMEGDDATLSSNTIVGNKNGICITGYGFAAIKDNTISMNTVAGIFLNCSSSNAISGNSVSKNKQGVYLVGSTKNTIVSNTFVKNTRQALFENCTNTWDQNYWGRPRILPKLILGVRSTQKTWLFPLVNVDWHPAQEPYDTPAIS